MAELTINKALVVQKSIRARISELTTLRSEVSTTDEFYGDSGKNRVKIPNYSVTRVDTKISELEAMLFDIDAAIKDSNAVTKIDIEGFDVKKIFEPLK